MKKNGYTPNAFARGLGLNSMNTIGVMCSDSSDPFIAKAISYLEKALRSHHYDMLLCCTGYEHSAKTNYMNLLLSKRTDAIILVGSTFVEQDDSGNDYIRSAAKEVPIMLINGALSASNLYATLCDDQSAVHEATTALIRDGKKSILYLYNAMSYSGNHKISGFLSALDKEPSDQHFKNQHLHYIDGTIQESREYLHSLSEKGFTFDAIVASDDTLAIGALKYAKDKSLNIPNDLSVVGYNNSIIASCSEPELTSIDNNVEALCNSCVTQLMQIFANTPVPSQTMYPAKLVKRESTSF